MVLELPDCSAVRAAAEAVGAKPSHRAGEPARGTERPLKRARVGPYEASPIMAAFRERVLAKAKSAAT